MTHLGHGTELLDGRARFRAWAPTVGALALRIQGQEHAMTPDGGGWWAAQVQGAGHGERYAYVFPDGRVRPDPASRRQPDGVHGMSQLWDPRRHAWRHAPPGTPLEALAFYELHVGTFTTEGTLDAAAERLGELAALGITCVELMPVQPFAGARNWGYDGVALHAVHEAYGGPSALQRFVDAAHGHGLAVCLDVVYNHLGPEGNYLRDFGPYFTRRHPSPWGDAVNYDGPRSGPVRALVIQAALAWVRDFRVDALRLDAVHAIHDDAPRHVVAELCQEVADLARAAGRTVHVVAESDLEDRRVVDPPPAGWGCAAMWSDDFHHAVHAWLTGERRAFLADFGDPRLLARVLREGFAYQGERSPWRGAPRGTGTAGLAPARFVVSLQNHDQVGNRARGDRLTTLLPWAAQPALAALLVLAPGLPLLFMGEEYGEERPFPYFTSHEDPALARAVTEGRHAEHETSGERAHDPQAEETFRAAGLSHRRDGRHGELWRHHRDLLAVRARHRDAIAGRWPEVTIDGTCVTLLRPGLEVAVNLGPEPAGGLPGWGYRVREGSRP